jgi:hypothetical protein
MNGNEWVQRGNEWFAGNEWFMAGNEWFAGNEWLVQAAC